jgi:hypothetical protein
MAERDEAVEVSRADGKLLVMSAEPGTAVSPIEIRRPA